MAWYPNRLAWHMNFSRAQLRKLPALEELHEFMKRENDAGAITRQEAVSMVPPFFLGVEPHHLVRDRPCHHERPLCFHAFALLPPFLLDIEPYHLVRECSRFLLCSFLSLRQHGSAVLIQR